MCLVYTPVAMNSAPSFTMAASTRSPCRSTNVTPLTSTTHLLVPFEPCDFFQLDLSCATHGPESRPCRVHRCPQGSSIMVILSTAVSAREVTLQALCHSQIWKSNSWKWMEMQEMKRNGKSDQGQCVSVPMPDSWHSADYAAPAKIANPGTEEIIQT